MRALPKSRRIERVSDLVDLGVSPSTVRRLVRSGDVVRVRHGAVRTLPGDVSAHQGHLDLIAATLPLLDDAAVLSHISAAVVHGFPLPSRVPEAVTVTRSEASARHRRKWLVTRTCPLPDDEVTLVRGMRVTTPERTAVDMAREYGFSVGVMSADWVLRQGRSREVMARVVERGRRRPGNATARRVVAFADARSESPGESMMRALLVQFGCPAPTLQLEVRDAHDEFIARTDFGWEQHRVVGEYDGKGKYGPLAEPGVTATDVVMAEKRRENLIRAQGWDVIRFDARDLARPEQAASRLMAALHRGRLHRAA
ncbi:type IV toxin-antitoxin system AbiEi family antitoxin domain-containing protein [Acidipropionibacterium timonense]|uniref:type IV toxin-antitoxin system AbiEi family antitoxin domain-containing protein n=1 Tax=Acidipropionibacterium timonense TaxID=2161818 RepID=UPI001030358C|nr:type IV toxin-antitoxin system AbiEi family antitoxin domain-containing protein [Acidipropionibacterium timonense]